MAIGDVAKVCDSRIIRLKLETAGPCDGAKNNCLEGGPEGGVSEWQSGASIYSAYRYEGASGMLAR